MKKTENQNGNSTGKIKAKSSAAEGLKELFVDELKDIVYAERALLKALPKMAKNASEPKLVTAIEKHVVVTQGQVDRLEKIFELLGESNRGVKCDAMEGLIKEGESIMEETEEGPVRDAGIISASQKIEHYEIASYGTLLAFAKTLGENEIASLLEATLAEEKEADALLTESAYNSINFEAAEADQD
ncbi:ferritin-like domain-containing protein [Chryseobacterium wangxinyae]|uniref:YciE/YciF ferroxidase family protein n=1 Tax=Chryseobacterium sp. CY350 TaxID=2997336 RepID=UPI00226D5024|nr:ferritin-like domain-containing protein [Chryseobacterium sp. CY350]MCY0976939.1 ferritin-like domain-containing protein [Chryseobacterium sp. CY350]WBZ96939.1 ferritin-like domain-containing protein [Chryseobacterium sp. CY350]